MNIQEIYAANALLKPFLFKIPLIFSRLLQKIVGKQVWLKLETQQPTGSFKAHPAFHNILKNLKDARKHGVIASSSGNFAQAAAYTASKFVVKPGGTEVLQPYYLVK